MILNRFRVLAALPVMATAGLVGVTALVLSDIDDILSEVAQAVMGDAA